MAETDTLIRAELEQLAPAGETELADFRQVRRRVGRQTRPVFLLAALITTFALAGVATATYLTFRSTASPAVNGPLLIATDADGALRIQTVGTDGRLLTTWTCPGRTNCGRASAVAWSPDGKTLAIAALSIAKFSPYDGLDLLNLGTGTLTNLLPYGQACPLSGPSDGFGYDLGWAHDGKHIVFTCRGTKIQVIDVKTRSHRAISTGLRGVTSPSWSPDGTQVAFAASSGGQSAIYVIDANGRHRHLVARHGRQPAWSPTDALIVYRAPAQGAACGALRLVTPDGRDTTPPTAGICHQFGPQQAGAPAWSPDGTHIAVSSNRGLYLVAADGSNLRRISTGGAYSGRPAWQPRHSGPAVEYAPTSSTCPVC